MNYEQAYKELNRNGIEIFKPSAGSTTVKVLEEPVQTTFQKMDGEDVAQLKIKIEVNGDTYWWYVSKGLTNRSLYGQLISLGKFRGKLAGESITLLVNPTSKNGHVQNVYSIAEAVKILPLLDTVEVAV